MGPVPFDQWTIEVSAPPEVVLERLTGAVDQQWFSYSSPRPLRGSLVGYRFRLRRTIHYRNSFLPQLTGTVEPNGSGSRVRVTMTLHPLVGVFMAVWLAGVAFGSVATVTADPQHAAIPLGMFAAGIAMTLGGYHWEAGESRDALETAVRGRW